MSYSLLKMQERLRNIPMDGVKSVAAGNHGPAHQILGMDEIRRRDLVAKDAQAEAAEAGAQEPPMIDQYMQMAEMIGAPQRMPQGMDFPGNNIQPQAPAQIQQSMQPQNMANMMASQESPMLSPAQEPMSQGLGSAGMGYQSGGPVGTHTMPDGTVMPGRTHKEAMMHGQPMGYNEGGRVKKGFPLHPAGREDDLLRLQMMQSGLGSMDPAVIALKLGKLSDPNRIGEIVENKVLMNALRQIEGYGKEEVIGNQNEVLMEILRKREADKGYHSGGTVHDNKHKAEMQGILLPGSWTEEELRAHAAPTFSDALSGRAFLGRGREGQPIGPVKKVGPGTGLSMQVDKLIELGKSPYGPSEVYDYKPVESTESPLGKASTQEQVDMLSQLGFPAETYDLVVPDVEKPKATSVASEYFRDRTRELLSRREPEEETDYIDRFLSSPLVGIGARMAAGKSPDAAENIGEALLGESERQQALKAQDRELAIQEQAARNLRPQVSLKDFLFSKGWNNERISELTMMDTDSEDYIIAMEQLKALEEEWRRNYGIGMRSQYAFREPLEGIIDLSGAASEASPAGARVIGQGGRGA
jgi:hypothetical protein